MQMNAFIFAPIFTSSENIDKFEFTKTPSLQYPQIGPKILDQTVKNLSTQNIMNCCCCLCCCIFHDFINVPGEPEKSFHF